MPTPHSRFVPSLNLHHDSFDHQKEYAVRSKRSDEGFSCASGRMGDRTPMRFVFSPSTGLTCSTGRRVKTQQASEIWETGSRKPIFDLPLREKGGKNDGRMGEDRYHKISIVSNTGEGGTSSCSRVVPHVSHVSGVVPLLRFGKESTEVTSTEYQQEGKGFIARKWRAPLLLNIKSFSYSHPSPVEKGFRSGILSRRKEYKYSPFFVSEETEFIPLFSRLRSGRWLTPSSHSFPSWKRESLCMVDQTSKGEVDSENGKDESSDISQKDENTSFCSKGELKQHQRLSMSHSSPSFKNESKTEESVSHLGSLATKINVSSSSPCNSSSSSYSRSRSASAPPPPPPSPVSTRRRKGNSRTVEKSSALPFPLDNAPQDSRRHAHHFSPQQKEFGEVQKMMDFQGSQQNSKETLERLAHRITLDGEPVVPPKVLQRCHARPPQWRRYPSHIIVMLLLQQKRLSPSRYPDIYNYHMAELFLRYIAICMEGAYFIYYEPGCIPRERFFRIRLSSEDWSGKSDGSMPVLPYLVATMHRLGASVMQSVSLHHLVGVSCGASGPSFSPFLLNSKIIQGCVERSRNRATFFTDGAFRLLFYDEKSHTSRTVDLLTSDHAVFDIWTKTFQGLTSVNSSSVVQIPLTEDGYNTEEREAFCQITMKNAEEAARLKRRKT